MNITVRKKSDLFVVTSAKDLAKYIITVTEKSPKQYRFTLVVRLQNYILEVLEKLYLANSSPLGEKRKNYQEEAVVLLGMLDYFAQLASEQNAILNKQYEQISLQVATTLDYLKKWMASDAKRMLSENK